MSTHLTKIWWDLNKHKLVEMAIPEAEIYKREWVGLTDDAVFGAICAGGITEQEPVAEIQAEDMGKPFNAIRVTVHFYAEVPAVGTKLYKAPPKREWVSLTDEEIQDLSYLSQKIDEGNAAWFDRLGFARAIEQVLKEKNHG